MKKLSDTSFCKALAAPFILGLFLPMSPTASTMFSNAQLANIIQNDNNATIKTESPIKFEINQPISDVANLKLILINVKGAIALRASFPASFLKSEDINEWNNHQTIYAYLRGDDVHLQSNIYIGSTDEIGETLPDKFIRLNYDKFVKTSEAFAAFINKKYLIYSQNDTKHTNSANPNASSFGTYVDDTTKAFGELAKIGDGAELQKKVNSGDYRALDEAMKGFQAFEKGLQDASKNFRESNGISDAQAQNAIREGNCRDACIKERSGCSAECPTGSPGYSCNHGCSSYYDACRIRCK